MDTGSLNKRVTFQTPTVIGGEGVTSWSNYCTVWAGIRPLVGQRRYVAKQLNSELAGQLTIRYRNDITTGMRILYESRYLEILALINPNESNEYLEIEYKEYQD